MQASHPVVPVPDTRRLARLARRALVVAAALAILVAPALLPVTRAQEGLPFKVYPQPGQREVWPGTTITLNFERDVDPESVVGALSLDPELAHEAVWRGLRQLELRPREPLEARSEYGLELGTGALDGSGRPLLEKPFAWTFSTSEHRSQLSFGWGLPVQLLAPSGEHGVGVQPGYPRVTLDLALYGLDLSGFATRYAPLERGIENAIDVEGLPVEARWQTHIDNSERMSGIGLPEGTAPGLYVIEAAHEHLGTTRALVIYSDHALVAKRGREGLGAWLTRWLSAEPAAGARVLALDAEGQTLAEATTDAEGLADLGALGALAETAALLAAEIEGETTLVGLDANWRSNQGYWRWWGGWNDTPAPAYTGHTHTDRPIYRPGHTVHWKTSIREFAGEGLAVIDAATPVSVTIRDAKSNVILREAPAVDAFGSVTGEITLGDEVALGWWQIETRVGEQTLSASFQVEEYVKPDFEVAIEPDADYYVRGDTAQITVQADYYYGQPVAGAVVVLRAYRGYWWRGEDGSLPVAELEGTTGPDGSFTGQLPLAGNESYAETYTLEAEVLDASRRPVYSTAYVPVHPADFALSLRAERYGVELGEPVVLTASTIGHDGQPVAGRELTVVIQRYTRDGTVESGRQTVTTGADGTAEVRYEDLAEGWYSFRADAADDGGRRVSAHSYAWIYDGARPWYWWGGLELSADRDQYAAGDTAQILVKSPITTTALVTIERDEVYEERVVEVSGATTLALPIEARHAPNVTVTVHLWQPNESEWSGKESQILTASVNLLVPADDKRLSVEVLPDAATHGPGEEATFTLRVRDAAGQPVDAQLSFALVDKAVLALASDRSGDIHERLWTGWQNAVRTYDSAVPGQTYDDRSVDEGGGGAPEPAPGGRGDDAQDAEEPSRAQPRREFRDTAHWEARLRTGPDGEATVTVSLPDNLTTWQALARAITVDSLAGQGSAELLVTQPIIAQPALPRFAVQGDQFVLDVLARNYALPGELAASCSLTTPGLIQLDPGPRDLSLPQGETEVARWSVVASQLGTNLVQAELDTAAGDDAIELPLEVQPFSVPDRFVLSGSTESVVAEPFEVPYKAVPESSAVTVRLAPSLAFGVLEGVESLIGYPYGCVEQTMGKVLPNAVVGRLAKHIELDAPEITQDLPEYMDAGLQKLYGFQNGDGSWGWWYSEGNLYTTSYVMHGLILVQEAGYEVSPEVMTRGLAWLAANLGQSSGGDGPRPPLPGQQNQDIRLQAYAAYVLSLGGTTPEAELLDRLYEGREKLDSFALATLAVALDRAGDARAEQALAALVARAERTATTVWWPAERSGERWDWYYWYSMASTEKATAMALEALTQLDPDSELAPMAARWLLEHRWGTGWRTTQATAFAILALTDHLLSSGDLDAAYDWTVALDGEVMAQGRVDSSNVTSPIDPVIIPGSELTPGPHVLEIRKAGRGTIYYTAVGDLDLFYEGFAASEAEGMGLSLRREYMPITGRSDPEGWHSGDLINVRLTVETRDELHYLIIEDKLPAGLEGLNQSLETETTRIPGGQRPWWRWWGYERHEVRDDAVTFFRSYLPPGTHTFEYAARAVTPGSFGARPAEAYAMYRPEVWARSATDRVDVDPTRVANRPDLPGDFDRDCRLTGFDANLTADAWSAGAGRDVNGDGRVSVADITLAAGRGEAGLACGDAVPAAPGEVGSFELGLDPVGAVQQNREFRVEIYYDTDTETPLGAWETTLDLPRGVELVDFEAFVASNLQANVLGPTDTDSGKLRLGVWMPEGLDWGGLAVDSPGLAILTLRATTDQPFEIGVTQVEAVAPDGGRFRATGQGISVTPEAWDPIGTIHLPSLMQQR